MWRVHLLASLHPSHSRANRRKGNAASTWLAFVPAARCLLPRTVPLSVDYADGAGTFDFPKYVSPGMSARDPSWRVSDHYPLWVEFSVRPPMGLAR
jgi:hypothetical protein